MALSGDSSEAAVVNLEVGHILRRLASRLRLNEADKVLVFRRGRTDYVKTNVGHTYKPMRSDANNPLQ